MKFSKNILFACIVTILFASCKEKSKNDDQAELAEEVNDEKFGKKSEKDAQFLVDAATISLAEISYGEIALTKTTDKNVMDLANMMILDHTKSYKEITALAQQKGFIIPSELTDASMAERKNLTDKEGNDFDKAYTDMMVKGHKDAIDKFEKATKETEDADIGNFASTTLIGLRSHLAQSEKCQDEVKK